MIEHVSLHKKLSTYISDAGRLKNVSDEVLYEVLSAWEEWTGTAKDFYKSIGFTHRQMAKLVGKAKQLKRDGYFGNESFKEIKVAPEVVGDLDFNCFPAIELVQEGKVIRFPQVNQLIDFLQKAS
ncbi:MAG: hypothetical protein AB8C84_08745 [Oligoflexales bacterium]